MKCPHCTVEIHFNWNPSKFCQGGEGTWYSYTQICPACNKTIIYLECKISDGSPVVQRFLIFPKRVARAACPPEVPREFAEDYSEAADVIETSPKATAALSRRCLQHLLREKAGATLRNLKDQIDYVLENCHLPSHVAESIDAVRNIGNFAAHPLKSTASGEIIEVEAGEAEWNLNVLESLFDFYFVQPGRVKAQRDALNKKLAEAGKPPMK